MFSTGQWKFSDFVTNYLPVGPKVPEPPEPGLLSPAPFYKLIDMSQGLEPGEENLEFSISFSI